MTDSLGSWDRVYFNDDALGLRFVREVAAALPVSRDGGTDEISRVDWRRLRLRKDQRISEWHPGVEAKRVAALDQSASTSGD